MCKQQKEFRKSVDSQYSRGFVEEYASNRIFLHLSRRLEHGRGIDFYCSFSNPRYLQQFPSNLFHPRGLMKYVGNNVLLRRILNSTGIRICSLVFIFRDGERDRDYFSLQRWICKTNDKKKKNTKKFQFNRVFYLLSRNSYEYVFNVRH